MSNRPVVYVVNNHHELLFLWRRLGFKQIKVIHLDSHCDMHGSLVDKKNNLIYILPVLKNVDCGNFISFAIQDGIIDSVKWIHDEYGGRDKDITHVKYNTDLSSLFYMIRNHFFPLKKFYFNYDELLFDNNLKIEENEHLDIDWDFFALKNKTNEERHKSIYSFFSLNFTKVPKYTYISYSGDYVAESKLEFNNFVAQLKNKFNAEVLNCANFFSCETYEKISKNIITKCGKGLNWRLRKYLLPSVKKQLNKIGIY